MFLLTLATIIVSITGSQKPNSKGAYNVVSIFYIFLYNFSERAQQK
jgi:hypothetical protein